MTLDERKTLEAAYGRAVFELKVAQAKVEALEKQLVSQYNQVNQGIPPSEPKSE